MRGEVSQADGFDLALAEEAQMHGVHGLVRQALIASDVWNRLDTATRAALDADVHRTALADGYFRRQTFHAVTALRNAGITTLIFKGEAIARTHYARPHLRPRCDTDLFVRKADAVSAGNVLTTLGYSQTNAVAREIVQTQQMFTALNGSMHHVVDLHWNISYRPFFADTFSFDELAQDSITIGDPRDGLRAPGPVHALVLACLHRVMHHENAMRLIWLSDISLLAERLTAREWTQVRSLAAKKSLFDICATGLEMAAARFGCSSTTLNEVAALRSAGVERQEPSRAYLGPRRGSLGRILLDARHAGGPLRSIQLLASHAFPDAEYMRRKYGVSHPLALAGAYLYRAASGFRRLTEN